MNVDILQSNPRWRLYLVFAAGTTTLTLVVWIAFKRNEEVSQWFQLLGIVFTNTFKNPKLENRIENKLRWLVKKKTRDVEEGYEDDGEENYSEDGKDYEFNKSSEDSVSEDGERITIKKFKRSHRWTWMWGKLKRS